MSTATVKERGILFKGEMVRAIMSGAKTQTRRIAKPPTKANFLPDDVWRNDIDEPGTAYLDDESGRLRIECQQGKPGDQLWVKETFRAIEDPGADKGEVRRKYRDEDGETHYIVVDYKIDAPTRIMDKMGKPEWKSALFMPRWASRITLEITDVRVERLRAHAYCPNTFGDYVAEGYPYSCGSEIEATQWFAELWTEINGATGPNSWDANPWVWAITFKRINK